MQAIGWNNLRSARLLFLSSLLLLGAVTNFFAQSDDVLCREGSGNFDADSQNGVKVHVGAVKNSGLASRSCLATLTSGNETASVATDFFEVDLDAFGVDVGLGVPVAAFQLKKSGAGCCRSYQIYSLEKHPRLLRSLTGGSSFRASDFDLDGRVEIWTDDAAAIDGLDNISFGEIDAPPTVVVRFEHNQLLNVSVQFQSYFDHLIADVRGRLDSQEVTDFKQSHGRLLPQLTASPDRIHRLRRAKIGILEIVWAYLYSDREADAWRVLRELWPASDVDRIRAEIVKARDRGIRAQLDGVSRGLNTRKKRAPIVNMTMAQSIDSSMIPPRAILLRRPPPQSAETALPDQEVSLTLIVDSAGKVRSVDAPGNSRLLDPSLLSAAMGWKFIPAYNGGRAVASRMRIAISPQR